MLRQKLRCGGHQSPFQRSSQCPCPTGSDPARFGPTLGANCLHCPIREATSHSLPITHCVTTDQSLTSVSPCRGRSSGRPHTHGKEGGFPSHKRKKKLHRANHIILVCIRRTVLPQNKTAKERVRLAPEYELSLFQYCPVSEKSQMLGCVLSTSASVFLAGHDTSDPWCTS